MSGRTSPLRRDARWLFVSALAPALVSWWIPCHAARAAPVASAGPKPVAHQDLPFKVPAGFIAERVAEPPLVEFPMFACFDSRGRLYVVDSAGVNWLPDQLRKNPPHRIRLLEDTDGDGRFDKSRVFADKLTYPQGVLWHDGVVYTASPPSLWRLEDTRGVGVADKRQELVTGFTFTKWADDLHGPFLGPDGRIYWTSGRYPHQVRRPGGKVVIQGDGPLLLRCRPDGRQIEAFCSGIGNPVEIAFSSEGEPFAAGTFAFNGNERDGVLHGVFGGVYPIKDRDVNHLQGIKRTGDLLPVMVHWPVMAPSGLMRYRSGAFGGEYRDNLFSALFARRAIYRHVLERDGATFRARSQPFLVARSNDFHPTDVLEDADGSLLVVDTGNWYNLCPSSQVGKTLVKGGIYRIRRKGAAAVADPRGLALPWHRLQLPDLALLLDDPRFAVRDRAVAGLAKRSRDAVPVLGEVLQTSTSVRARRHTVWALTRIEDSGARAAVRRALADKNQSVRLAATNSVGLHRDAQALPRLMELLAGDAPPVRREAATALGRIGRASAVPALLNSLRAGCDSFQEHALIFALIDIADRPATLKGLSDPSPLVRRGALIALDQMAGGNLTRELVTPLLNTDDPTLQKTALEIITARPGWAQATIQLLERWLGQKDVPADRQNSIRGAILAFCRDPAIQALVARTLGRAKTPLATRLLLLETIARAPLEPLPPAWSTEVGRSLEDQDGRVVRQAVTTIRTTHMATFDARLLHLAKDASRPSSLRTEALAAVASRLGALAPDLLDFLVARLHADVPPLERLAAAEALGNARLNDKQLEALTKALADAGPLEVPHLLAAFAHCRNPEVGQKLVAALAKSPGLPSLAPNALRRTLQGYPQVVRQAVEPLLRRLHVDSEKQKTRLAELEPVLTGGNPQRGREVFFGKKAACLTCHTVQGEGGRVGPDLSKIGAIRSSRDLLEAIVFPSASFARGYEPYVIATKDGRFHTGIIARETAEAIFLVTAERAEIRLARSALESIERGRVSIMPQGLDAQLSRQELSDLIAFLSGRK